MFSSALLYIERAISLRGGFFIGSACAIIYVYLHKSLHDFEDRENPGSANTDPLSVHGNYPELYGNQVCALSLRPPSAVKTG